MQSISTWLLKAYCVLGTQKVKRSRTDLILDLRNLTALRAVTALARVMGAGGGAGTE